MTSDMQHLLLSKRFLPLFVTQFLGAANDNLFKSALVMLITFVLAEQAGLNGPLMVTVAAGVFILPFFLFSAWAGQLADRFDKAKIAKVVKFAEIIIMGGAVLAFQWEDAYVLMAVLFLMGAQSTVFGPVKYSILPQHLDQDELIAGNALIESGTFLAILLGTIVGGLLVLSENGVALVSVMVVAIAAAGFAASLFIPAAPAPSPNLRVTANPLAGTVGMLKHAAKRSDVFLSILGISWFWLVGATFLSQFPTFAKVNLGGDEGVVTLFLSVFSVGIGIGSALCSNLLKGEITAKYVPMAALLMTAFMTDLYLASDQVAVGIGHTVKDFLATVLGARITFDLLMVAVAGGLYIVPLYAILQSRGEETHRARDIAANNIYNALFMVVSALIVSAMLAAGMSVPGIFMSVAAANALVALYISKLLPKTMITSAMHAIRAGLNRSEGVGRASGSPSRASIVSGGLLAIVVAVFAFVPPIAQDPAYHQFADGRGWMGVPNFADVVSNVAFVAVGLWGLWVVWRMPAWPARVPLLVVFLGVSLVGPGSVYYHVAPDNLTLFWDRLPITMAFMGLMAAVIAERIDPRRGASLWLPLLVLAGVASAVWWRMTEAQGAGDLRAYALVQFLPMIAIPALIWAFPDPAARIGWRAIGLAFLAYGLAKVAELFDPQILDILGKSVSGHTLKHVLAALGPLFLVLCVSRKPS